MLSNVPAFFEVTVLFEGGAGVIRGVCGYVCTGL